LINKYAGPAAKALNQMKKNEREAFLKSVLKDSTDIIASEAEKTIITEKNYKVMFKKWC
jgi:hypothetical protein